MRKILQKCIQDKKRGSYCNKKQLKLLNMGKWLATFRKSIHEDHASCSEKLFTWTGKPSKMANSSHSCFLYFCSLVFSCFVYQKFGEFQHFCGHRCQYDFHEIREVCSSGELLICLIITFLEISYIFTIALNLVEPWSWGHPVMCLAVYHHKDKNKHVCNGLQL